MVYRLMTFSACGYVPTIPLQPLRGRWEPWRLRGGAKGQGTIARAGWEPCDARRYRCERCAALHCAGALDASDASTTPPRSLLKSLQKPR